MPFNSVRPRPAPSDPFAATGRPWALRTLACALAGLFSAPAAQAAEFHVAPGQTQSGLRIHQQGSHGRHADDYIITGNGSTPGGPAADVRVRNEGAITAPSGGGDMVTISAVGGRGGDGERSYTPSAGGRGGSIHMVNDGSLGDGAPSGNATSDALLSLVSRGGEGGSPSKDPRLGAKYGPADGGAAGTITFTTSSSVHSNARATLRLRSEGGVSGQGRFSDLAGSRPPRARGGSGGAARAQILQGASLSNTNSAGTAERPAIAVHVVTQGGQGARGGDAGPLGTVTAHGNDGGTGGLAEVVLDGAIITEHRNTVGVIVSSMGGAGGQGGTDSSRLNSWPGLGGAGGSGGTAVLHLSSTGSISTKADDAPGALVESRGGDGGDAGLSTFALLVSGVPAGSGANVVDTPEHASVQFRNAGTIATQGNRSAAITLQSVGGQGGAGTPKGGSGSQGGAGGAGGRISALNTGTVSTQGEHAYGLFAQSVGGTGGLGGDGQFGFSFGGAAGGNAGRGGDIHVDNQGTIITQGQDAIAVVAQSVGGGRALEIGRAHV